jgi:rhodanese-related sulfurtransferase
MILALALLLSVAGAAWAADETVPRMSKEEVKAELDAQDLVIVDVRTGKDWTASEFKLPGAVRVDPYEPDPGLADLDPADRYVLYCA